MNDEDKPLIMSDEQVIRLMGVKRKIEKPQTNGRGVGIWLLLSGAILFAFEQYCGLAGGIMWALRGVGLICLLVGALFFGASFEKAKEDRG